MLLLCSSSLLQSNPVKPHRAASLVTESVNLQAHKPKSIPTTIPTRQSWVSFCSPTYLGKGLVFPPHPTPELGLLSLWFVLSLAFRRLAVSMDGLLRVVKEEVPGTLFSLRLSALEINDLTHQLTNLRYSLSPSPFASLSLLTSR
ncbi:uncharacterized protein LOC100853372 isoform X3 [Vitis vinifera]|uniref:uncharacterized protein LOC100853372 isoform X3 n=1 Tax=Vitis vinifera TaxID=29760 RepID=UPI00053F9D31|nr:uncharacterized protein LOC100853372 isoform X3 [Vitis vinifera]